MILDREHVEHYLEMARSMSRDRPLYDMHVSPYEVIFCQYDYKPNSGQDGVYSVGERPYKAPGTGIIKLEESTAGEDREQKVPSTVSLMMYKNYYAHIGPRVFADHMERSGITRNLFIPVVQPDSDGEEQFRLMFDLYRDDERFMLAYCPPKLVEGSEVHEQIKRVVSGCKVKAVKINPNIQAIDLSAPAGQEWVQHVFDACEALRLPLMIHGGVSKVTRRDCACGFSAMDNLMPLPWCDISVPVILSHAGLFGASSSELPVLMPKLQNILKQNSNVMVDISGLRFDVLCSVLREIDYDRIVFGSDSLYFPQWSAVARLLHALDRLGARPEDVFVQLAGINPEKVLLGSPCL